jgi:hypothetical protein
LVAQVFSRMTYSETLEQSFYIAWDVLTRSGELRDPEASAGYLLDKIEGMMKSGERRRLLLSNLAIDAYRLRYKGLKLVS